MIRRMSDDGKSWFDEHGNEWALFCFFCGRGVRRGIDICWKCERAMVRCRVVNAS